jgi:hypothetical protein
MSIRRVGILAAALLAFSAPPTQAQGSKDWVEIKDPDELRALYSNKTFRFIHAEVNKPAAIYYRADGKGVMVLGDRRYPRTWEIKGANQVCINDDIRGQWCYRVQRNLKKTGEILLVPGIGGVGQFMTVEDGIPKF